MMLLLLHTGTQQCQPGRSWGVRWVHGTARSSVSCVLEINADNKNIAASKPPGVGLQGVGNRQRTWGVKQKQNGEGGPQGGP